MESEKGVHNMIRQLDMRTFWWVLLRSAARATYAVHAVPDPAPPHARRFTFFHGKEKVEWDTFWGCFPEELEGIVKDPELVDKVRAACALPLLMQQHPAAPRCQLACCPPTALTHSACTCAQIATRLADEAARAMFQAYVEKKDSDTLSVWEVSAVLPERAWCRPAHSHRQQQALSAAVEPQFDHACLHGAARDAGCAPCHTRS